jgi:predicted metal-dependent peptidase
VLGRLLEPKLPWRMLLARYVASLARDDYSFQRPARREGHALLPRLHSGQLEVYVVLDTSGSIGETELREFVSEIDALKGQVRARVTVHACDYALAAEGPWVAQPWEPIALPEELSGGGGTNFSPVFDWLTRERLRPDVLIYFTDAEGDFPPAPPPFPVLWLVKGRGAVPWGERIQLN